jgi:hypothetical protein
MSDLLDDRIRSMVESVVRTAPAPPDLESLRDADRPEASRGVPTRWMALAAAAAVAVAAAAALIRPSDEKPLQVGNPTETTQVPGPAPAGPPVVLTAGPNGVVERVGDDKRTLTTKSFTIALAVDDGTFVAQRRSGPSMRDGVTWPKSDTSVLRIDEGGHTTPLFDAVSGFVTLHDVAVVDGRRLLLYSVHNGNFNDPKEELYALDIDSGTHPVDVGTVGGWEWGTSRLTLGTNGLIIGTSRGVCCSSGSFHAMAVPGSPAAAKPLPKAADFGLQDGYEDGCVCPTAFAVDPDGTAVYWLSPVEGGPTVTVVRAPLDDPLHHTEVAPVARLDASRLQAMSIDADDDRFVVTFGNAYSGPMQPPMEFTSDSSTTLEGDVATLGPNG